MLSVVMLSRSQGRFNPSRGGMRFHQFKNARANDPLELSLNTQTDNQMTKFKEPLVASLVKHLFTLVINYFCHQLSLPP